MRLHVLLIVPAILLMLTSQALLAAPYSAFVTISRSVTFSRTLNPLGEVVSTEVTTKITIQNNLTFPLTLYVYDIEEEVGALEISHTPFIRRTLVPGYELLGWHLKVGSLDTAEITIRGTPLEELPLDIEIYYCINGKPAAPVKEGKVWKLKVDIDDRLTIALKLTNRLPRLFNGISYDKIPLSVLVSIPFPEDILELEYSNMEPSRLLASSWILTTMNTQWLNVTYRVKSLGAWGEVSLEPITITCLPSQDTSSMELLQAREAEQLAKTLMTIQATIKVLRIELQSITQAIVLAADSIKVPEVDVKALEDEHKLSKALKEYSNYMLEVAEMLDTLSNQTEESIDLLIKLISVIDPSQLTNPSPEFRNLMANLTAISYGLTTASTQLEIMSESLGMLSEGVEGLENATEALSHTLLSISQQVQMISKRLNEIAEHLSMLDRGLYSVEEVLANLSSAYFEKARVLMSRQALQGFQQRFCAISRAWAVLSREDVRMPIGYRLSRRDNEWIVSDVRIRNLEEHVVMWLSIKVENGLIESLTFERQPANLTSALIELSEDRTAVLIPVFSQVNGKLAHPILGEFSLAVKAEGRPRVVIEPLYVPEDEYIIISRQSTSYTFSIEMPILSREVLPSLPTMPIYEEEVGLRIPYRAILTSVLLLIIIVCIYRMTKRRAEDVELAKLEEELYEVERRLVGDTD